VANTGRQAEPRGRSPSGLDAMKERASAAQT
jgi:hypothetical protein